MLSALMHPAYILVTLAVYVYSLGVAFGAAVVTVLKSKDTEATEGKRRRHRRVASMQQRGL